MGTSGRDPHAPAERHSRLGGWGAAPPEALRLARRIGRELERTSRVRISRAATGRWQPPQVPPPKLDAAQLESLARMVAVFTDDDARRAYSLGKSYPDLVAARSGSLERACDAVVRPTSEDDVRRVLDWCAERSIAVIPVGGGTSVVGGIEPIGSSPEQPVLALDVTKLAGCAELRSDDRVAVFGAGTTGPRLEAELAPRGLTLGHMPQSFAYATLGGWIATRSSGQASLKFGRIESLTAGLRLVSPAGTVEVEHLPAHGAGPDLAQLLLGSEGSFGVITQATVRLSVRPERVRFTTALAPSFEDATRAARALVQGGLRPAMVRVSDAAETVFALSSSVTQQPLRKLGSLVGRGLGLGQGASMIFVVMLGDADEVDALDRRVGRLFRSQGLRIVGPMPARHWFHGRFLQPHARDILMDQGLIVDTLETAVPWSRLHAVHRGVRAALDGVVGEHGGLVGCHLSHLYPDGASAYFTFMTPAGQSPDDALARWRRAKRAVHDVLAAERAAVSHQHGVGTMHADLYRQVTPDVALAGWEAARAVYDPAGIMAPASRGSVLAEGIGALNAVGA